MIEPEIAEGRRVLKPETVNRHKYPLWLIQKLKHAGLDDLPHGEWLDHYGTCGEDFVSEPYWFDSKTAKALDTVCEKLGGVVWHVEANSWHYPGSSIRIVLTNRTPYRGRRGFVYFVQAGTDLDAPIKIGFTENVKQRMQQLQTGNPVALTLLLELAGDEAHEAELHAEFAEHRLEGEWFWPDPEILDFVARNR